MLAVDAVMTGGRPASASSALSAASTDREISSCRAKMSASVRSYCSHQTWKPPAASMSWAEMRSRSPALRTLPSSTDPTPSWRPISRTSASRPLNANDELWATTRSSGTFVRPLISSSDRPSQK